MHFQWAEWNREVMIVDEFLALEIQLSHRGPQHIRVSNQAHLESLQPQKAREKGESVHYGVRGGGTECDVGGSQSRVPLGRRFADTPVAAAENRSPHARMPAVPQKRRDADRSDMLISLGPGTKLT